MGEVDSRIPWFPLGLLVLVLLWLPSLWQLDTPSTTRSEIAWVEEVLTGLHENDGSAFARLLSRSTWEWLGVHLVPGAELTPSQWRAVRIPSAAASLAGLIVCYVLARLVVGSAAGLLAATLLACAAPWNRAGASAVPLLAGEVLVLLGVLWAIHLQARHREVEMARISATRIGIAGVLFGIGMLLMPAAFATFLTALLVWLFLGLRRSSSDATTLPVESPGDNAFLVVFGTVVFLGAALIAAWGVEGFAGGSGARLGESFTLSVSRGVELWAYLYRWLLSPGPTTDWLVVAALLVILLIRWVEWSAGSPWQAAGLAPWVFLGAYFLALRYDGIKPSDLDVPVTVPPLFVLGFGWLILRGLHVGRVRRQEYTFLVVWLVMGVLWVPFVPAGHPHDPLLAATLGLLPAVVLVAGRAGRSLWESEEPTLARLAIFAIGYVPVVAFMLSRVAGLGAPDAALARASGVVDAQLYLILLGAILLGVLSEFFTVRPELVAEPEEPDRPAGRRRGRRGGRRRRGGGPGGRGGRGRGHGPR